MTINAESFQNLSRNLDDLSKRDYVKHSPLQKGVEGLHKDVSDYVTSFNVVNPNNATKYSYFSGAAAMLQRQSLSLASAEVKNADHGLIVRCVGGAALIVGVAILAAVTRGKLPKAFGSELLTGGKIMQFSAIGGAIAGAYFNDKAGGEKATGFSNLQMALMLGAGAGLSAGAGLLLKKVVAEALVKRASTMTVMEASGIPAAFTARLTAAEKAAAAAVQDSSFAIALHASQAAETVSAVRHGLQSQIAVVETASGKLLEHVKTLPEGDIKTVVAKARDAVNDVWASLEAHEKTTAAVVDRMTANAKRLAKEARAGMEGTAVAVEKAAAAEAPLAVQAAEGAVDDLTRFPRLDGEDMPGWRARVSAAKEMKIAAAIPAATGPGAGAYAAAAIAAAAVIGGVVWYLRKDDDGEEGGVEAVVAVVATPDGGNGPTPASAAAPAEADGGEVSPALVVLPERPVARHAEPARARTRAPAPPRAADPPPNPFDVTPPPASAPAVPPAPAPAPAPAPTTPAAVPAPSAGGATGFRPADPDPNPF